MMRGRTFWKMSGSGNDFVFFESMSADPGPLTSPETIAALCDRRSGVGADGVVFLEQAAGHAFGMRYFNRDGTLAEMCGNAALCSARLARELGIVEGGAEFSFETPSGPVRARFRDGLPAIDMVPISGVEPSYPTSLEPGELRIGFARVGVPHLVVLCHDVSRIDVHNRGRQLRHLASLQAGANANFVSPGQSTSEWVIRTYERGVEEETLACGTGAVAAAALLASWGFVTVGADLRTRSNRVLSVGLPSGDAGSSPVLRGEGRIVFRGEIVELPA